MKFFEALANAFKIPDLRNRILFTLGMLAIYRLGGHIPTPGIDAERLEQFFQQNQGTLFGFIDLFSGGMFRRLTVFALGIMPYITSSILLQLMTIVVPTLEKLSKEGELGRRKITHVGQVSDIAGQVSDVAGQVTNVVGQASDITGSIGGIGDIAGSVGDIGNIAGSVGDIGGSVSGIAGSVSDTQEKIQALLEKYAPKIAKYMKIVFNKISEYISKKINAAMGPLTDIMFPNQRFQFLDIKIEINEKIKCLFSKITQGLGPQILGALGQILDKKNPSTNKTPTSPGTAPFVPICSVEELTGNLIAANMGDIDKTVGDITKSVETFLNDIQDGLSLVTGLTNSIKIPDINGSIASALSFVNIALDIFGCDSKPNCAASDFYTLQEGAGAAEEAQLPRPAEVNEAAKDPGPVTPATTQPFATPAKNTPDFDSRADASTQRQIEQRTAGLA